MKKSNKILAGFVSVVTVIYILIALNFEPEYRKSAIRNIPAKFKVVTIEDDIIKPENVLFTGVNSVEETAIYYEQGGFRKWAWHREAKDTLILVDTRYVHFDSEKKLHINLQGVDAVLLRGEVLYKK